MQKRFCLKGREGRPTGKQACQEGADMRSGETAAGNFLAPATGPGDFDVLAASGEFDQLAEAAKEQFSIRAAGKTNCGDTRKMTRPFAFQKILVVAGSDDVPAEIVSLIDPILVKEHLVVAVATKAAVQNVVASLKGLARALPDDQGAGTQMLAQNAKASDLRLRCQFANDPCDCGAVAIDIAAVAWHGSDSMTLFDNREVVGESQALEERMRRVNARIEHGNFDVRSFGAAQERACLLNRWRGICPHSLQPTVEPNSLSSMSCDKTAVAR
jgi:hypothetical protein